ALPICEVMMKPVVEGRVLQALDLQPGERVLEIGTGSGYLAACLAMLAGTVVSVDIHADFIAAAKARLATAGIGNVTLATGEAVDAWQPEGQFDAIVATGAVHQVPARWLGWLKPGARLIAVRGASPAQQVLRITHEGELRSREEALFETDLPYLVHAEPPRRFVF